MLAPHVLNEKFLCQVNMHLRFQDFLLFAQRNIETITRIESEQVNLCATWHVLLAYHGYMYDPKSTFNLPDPKKGAVSTQVDKMSRSTRNGRTRPIPRPTLLQSQAVEVLISEGFQGLQLGQAMLLV